MCGIVGAIAERNVVPILVEGLRRLEYRGYDSAGVAVLESDGSIGLRRTVGKVAELEAKLDENPLRGRLGVAHTRWATHGGVTEANAHPHLSGDRVAVIHNGIIENYQEIKDELEAKGYEFASETDTEVAAHLLSRRRIAGVHDHGEKGIARHRAQHEEDQRRHRQHNDGGADEPSDQESGHVRLPATGLPDVT